MSEPVQLPLDDAPLIDPPIIDFARFDDAQQGYAITFVPEDMVSRNEKEMILIRRDDAEWMHFRHAWAQMDKLLPAAAVHIAHAGGGDFTFKLSNGKVYNLAENSPSNDLTQRLYDVLQRLGMIAQIQFLIQLRAQSKSA